MVLFKGYACKIIKCVGESIYFSRIMQKWSLPNPPKKKLKLNQKLIEMPMSKNANEKSRVTGADSVQNLNLTTAAADNSDNMQAKRQSTVEYLETPVKSENDKKEYRVVRLENGLTALLISDVHSATCSQGDESDEDDTDESESEGGESGEDESEDDSFEDGESDNESELPGTKAHKREEKMAACGLCVGVGSFSDPPEIPGMAHFLEHMVFMGSSKYPQENDFDAFVKKRGGSDNASTECEQTTFYFTIQEKHLYATLDRFAQFFISPLMKRDAITREREAVESEFQLALPSDFYRKEQLFCSLAQPGHPATKFTWGNLKTLRDNVTDDKLYEELHKFRERHYSAHRMTLAVQARLSLDTLEQYVKDCFSDVPNNGLPPDDFTKFKGSNSFATPSFRRIYKIKPDKDLCQLELTWAMPSLLHLYKSKPHQYVSWIIGHEGKGSLISYLRKKMWCLDIYTGNGEDGFEHSSMYALFSLSLVLTDEGLKHLKEVIDAIFSYISLMRKEGPQRRIYDEIFQIEETNFRFTDETPPSDYVEDLCASMHFYSPADYITGSDLYFEYNPEGIKTCMDALSAENVNIIVFDKKINDEELDKVEPWFQTKYTDLEIPGEWVESWKTIEPLADFHLPEPNIFLTDDFSLIPVDENRPKYPVKLHSDAISEIWYKPDTKFGLPECYMSFYLISPLKNSSPHNAAMMDLFVAVLKQLLVEELYPATAAELNYNIYIHEKGIIINVNGFNQKLPLLATTITKYIANCSELVTEDLFNILKVEQLKFYYNTFLKPRKLIKDVRLTVLTLVHWPVTDKHAALSGIEYHQFQNFTKHFTDHIYIQCLVQGNMAKEDVLENGRNCIETLKCGPLLPHTLPHIRVTQIPLGVKCCRVKTFNPTDTNSVVTNYYQSGTPSIKLTVIIELLIMIMEEPLFNQLRTQEQLGYNVFCLMRDTYGILGYSITVHTQADKYTTEHVDERIEEFLKSFVDRLKKMSEKELGEIKESLINLKRCADIHLKEEVDKNWAEITTGEYMFDRVDKEIAAISGIKINELRKWMTQHVLNGDNLRKLSIQVVGASTKNSEASVENNVPVELNGDNTQGHEKPLEDSTVKSRNCYVEYGGDVKFPLEYIQNMPNEKKRKGAEYYITDIEDYKHGLYVYPTTRTAT